MLKMPILNFVFSRNCLVLRRDEWYFNFDDTRGSLFSRGEGGHFMKSGNLFHDLRGKKVQLL